MSNTIPTVREMIATTKALTIEGAQMLVSVAQNPAATSRQQCAATILILDIVMDREIEESRFALLLEEQAERSAA